MEGDKYVKSSLRFMIQYKSGFMKSIFDVDAAAAALHWERMWTSKRVNLNAIYLRASEIE